MICIAAAGALMPFHYVYSALLPVNAALMGLPDSAAYFSPLAVYVDNALWSGEFPFWNPLVLCGYPAGANPQSALFYPPYLVRALLTFAGPPLASVISLRLFGAFHLLLGFAGALLLARRLGYSWPAAFVAGMCFSFNFLCVSSVVGAWVLIGTASWFPWMLLAARQAVLADVAAARMRWCAAVAAFTALALLAGAVQVFLYCVVLTGLYAAVTVFQAKGGDLKRPRILPAMVAPLLFLAGAFLFAALLAMVALLPAQELAGLSSRGVESQAAVSFKVDNGWTVFPYNFRLVVMLLMFLGVARCGLHAAFPALVLLLATLDLFTGWPAPLDMLLRAVSPFQLSSPNRVAVLLGLPVGLLAGLGADALQRGRLGRAGTASAIFFVAAGAAAYHYWPFAATPALLFVYAVPLGALLVVLAVQRWRIQWLPVCVVLAIFAEQTSWNNAAILRSFAKAAPETAGHLENIDLCRAARMETANARGLGPFAGALGYDLRASMGGCEPVQLENTHRYLCNHGSESMYARFVGADDVGGPNRQGSMLLKRKFWLSRQYAVGPPPPKNALYPVSVVTFLDEAVPGGVERVQRDDLPATPLQSSLVEATLRGKSEILEAGSAPVDDAQREKVTTDRLLKYDFALLQPAPGHRAAQFMISSRYPCRASFRVEDAETEEVLVTSRLKMTGMNQQVSHWLPLPEAMRPFRIRVYTNLGSGFTVHHAALQRERLDEDHLIRIEEYTANRARVRVGPLESSRVLTYVDADYPGWTASIDGAPTTLYRAHGAFKAVVLGPGEHLVTFEFVPTRSYFGAIVSILSTLFLVATSYVARR